MDASAACTWCLPDERSDRGARLLGTCLQAFAVVPALWPTEVTNALRMAERRGRIAQREVNAFLVLLLGMNIKVQPSSLQQSQAILDLSRSENLTVYDAAYLHLAQEAALPLATFDEALTRAAQRRNIPLL